MTHHQIKGMEGSGVKGQIEIKLFMCPSNTLKTMKRDKGPKSGQKLGYNEEGCDTHGMGL